MNDDARAQLRELLLDSVAPPTEAASDAMFEQTFASTGEGAALLPPDDLFDGGTDADTDTDTEGGDPTPDPALDLDDDPFGGEDAATDADWADPAAADDGAVATDTGDPGGPGDPGADPAIDAGPGDPGSGW